MRAIQVHTYVDSPNALHVSTLPTPTPSPTAYLISIHACGTNFFDLLQIRGKYQHQPPLPWISGAEFAGVVISTPTSGNQHQFKAGDRVFGATQGAYATHILAPESALLPIPDGWSFEDAAGLQAGGVGLSAVQVAKALGATVIATAGTARKREVCQKFGADHVVDYSDLGWPKQVVEICKRERSTANGRAGVDVVYDPVGLIEQSLKCVAWNARLLVIGFAGGQIEKVALNRVLLKNVSIVGLHWGMYKDKQAEVVGEVWGGIFELIAQGKLRGIGFSDRRFEGLESVPAALVALGGRETWGKVVVTLRDGEGDREVDQEDEEAKGKERQSKL